MSVFSVGGGVGYAIGPLVVAATLAPLGLHGTVVIALIPIAAAVVVGVALRRFRLKPLGEHARHRQIQDLGSEWRPFACLVAMFCVASGVSTGLITFVPLFLVQARATSPAASNVMTSVLLAAAACGTLLGGIAAHRYGRRVVLLAPQVVLVPAIALLPSLSYAAMIPVVILIGIAVNANVSVALVLAQEYLPARMGLATGLTIGMCGGGSAASSWPRSACSATPPDSAQCSMRSRRSRSWPPCSPPGCRGLRPPRPALCGACAPKPRAEDAERLPGPFGAIVNGSAADRADFSPPRPAHARLCLALARDRVTLFATTCAR